MARCVGPKLAGAVMRQILKDAAMDFAQVVNVKLALNRVQSEFDDARICARGFIRFNQGGRCRRLQPLGQIRQ